MKYKKNKSPNTKIRYNILTTIVYIAGIILIAQLFNLQIIHGEEYRETSDIKLTRESTIKASRGSIKDNSGNTLAGVETGFSLELYKSKLSNEALNTSILNIINLLEQNGDTYTDTFPIAIEPFGFKNTNVENQIQWKEKNGIDKNATAEECFYYFKNKYEITNEDIKDIKKIITVRYRITQEGYSSTKSIVISKNISKKSILQLQEQGEKFPGINIVTEAIRTYPYGNLASHILGYIGNIGTDLEEAQKENPEYNMNDIYGKSGIERTFERYLKGKNGIRQIDMSVDGTVTDEYTSKEAEAGADVILTIDANFQSKIEQILKDTVESVKGGSSGGAIVAINVSTGAILGMASYPTYEPSSFVGGIDQETWQIYNQEIDHKSRLTNRATQAIYAPGSTFKMITAITGLETGKITPTTTINDTGVYPRAYNPKCWIYSQTRGGHGYLNVKQALQRSCNYFFYEVGYRVGIDQIYKYAKYFGLDSKTGVELPAESPGNAAQQSSAGEAGWYLGDTLPAAIGQGYNSFTPIGMSKYVSMIANGGKKVRPTLIKSITKSDGTELSREEIRKYVDSKLGIEDNDEDLTISETTIQTVKEGMLAVTSSPGGTAYSVFKDFNVQVAGKTGTADVTDSGDIANGWFIGFAPYNEPEIAVAVVIENGGSGQYATIAAKEVLAQYFGMNSDKIVEDRTVQSYVEMQN